MQIVNSEGLRALTTGLGSTIFGYALHGGLKYGLYELFKPAVVANFPDLASGGTLFVFMAAGASAELIASTFLCPLEATRIRLVTDPSFGREVRGNPPHPSPRASIAPAQGACQRAPSAAAPTPPPQVFDALPRLVREAGPGIFLALPAIWSKNVSSAPSFPHLPPSPPRSRPNPIAQLRRRRARARRCTRADGARSARARARQSETPPPRRTTAGALLHGAAGAL
jgi:hypothetical protein